MPMHAPLATVPFKEIGCHMGYGYFIPGTRKRDKTTSPSVLSSVHIWTSHITSS